MDSTDICFKSASEMLALINAREISVRELVLAHIAQIDRVNPCLNAIVTYIPEKALERAEEVDRELAGGTRPGVLAGLPIAHKDLVATKGIRTTFGSRIYANNIPDADALMVRRLKAAGAICLGKTNTPEWGAGSQTFNEVFGATRNPYDPTKTCGGSSGGAAVALASGMIAIADGSDMGGSLRNPANFCNVVGLRTCAGRVPRYPVGMAWNALSVLGPMARNVEDTALLLSVIAGPDHRCPISIQEPGSRFRSSLSRDFKGTRIAWSADFGHLPVADDVRQVIRGSISAFESVGCVTEANMPDFADADYVFKTLRAWSFASGMQDLVKNHPELVKDTIHWNVGEGLKLSGEDIAAAETLRTGLFERVSEFMSNHEFLILPVSQVAPFDIETEWIKVIDGVKMDTYIDWMKSCYYISALGLPAISVPAGFTAAGLPVGVQIVGRGQDEFGVLQLAYAFQQATGLHKRRPQLDCLSAAASDGE